MVFFVEQANLECVYSNILVWLGNEIFGGNLTVILSLVF